MTATNIQIMKESAENKLFEHNLEASVCAKPVRPVKLTGQTSLHGTITGPTLSILSDRCQGPVRLVATQKLNFTSKLG